MLRLASFLPTVSPSGSTKPVVGFGRLVREPPTSQDLHAFGVP